MPSPYLQSILSAIQHFDIDQLDFLLNDTYTYQDTTKDVFLAAFKKVFAQFNNDGDTALNYTAGACGSKSCGNCGKRGYRFVGNHSNSYINLIFEELEGDVKDIFECYSFNSLTEEDTLTYRISLDIRHDDNVEYVKTPHYWRLRNAAQAAYEEMVTTPPMAVNMDDIEYWLAKHKITYQDIGGYDIFKPKMNWSDFLEFYDDLTKLSAFITTHRKEIVESTAAINLLDGEEMLLDWLIKYEHLENEIPFSLKYGKYALEANSTSSGNVIISDVGINKLRMFLDFYDKQSNAMLEKYSIYTGAERMEVLNSLDGPEYKFIYSIRFHLDKRQEAREMGVEIGLYLDHDTENANENSPPPPEDLK